MYQHILLAVALQDWDHYSSHALAARDVAMTLALGVSAHLHVLSVYHHDETPYGYGLTAEMAARHREDTMEQTTHQMTKKMQEYVTPLVEAGLKVDTLLEAGNPRERIVETARRLPADLLIIGSHSKRGVVDVSLGVTARQVSAHASCPIIFVSPQP